MTVSIVAAFFASAHRVTGRDVYGHPAGLLLHSSSSRGFLRSVPQKPSTKKRMEMACLGLGIGPQIRPVYARFTAKEAAAARIAIRSLSDDRGEHHRIS